jgi:hypothetical protein
MSMNYAPAGTQPRAARVPSIADTVGFIKTRHTPTVFPFSHIAIAHQHE